jgi:hypothetical protein
MGIYRDGGQFYIGLDAGETWAAHPSPPGGTQVYALARLGSKA